MFTSASEVKRCRYGGALNPALAAFLLYALQQALIISVYKAAAVKPDVTTFRWNMKRYDLSPFNPAPAALCPNYRFHVTAAIKSPHKEQIWRTRWTRWSIKSTRRVHRPRRYQLHSRCCCCTPRPNNRSPVVQLWVTSFDEESSSSFKVIGIYDDIVFCWVVDAIALITTLVTIR